MFFQYLKCNSFVYLYIVAIAGFNRFYLDSRQRKQYISQIKEILNHFVYVDKINLDIIKATWLEDVMANKSLQPGTIANYFNTLAMFLEYLVQSQPGEINVEAFVSMRLKVKRWGAFYTQERRKQDWSNRLNKLRKLTVLYFLSITHIHTYTSLSLYIYIYLYIYAYPRENKRCH